VQGADGSKAAFLRLTVTQTAFPIEACKLCILYRATTEHLQPVTQEYVLRMAPPEERQQHRFLGSFPLVR
jgi:hypothetical protein